MKINAINFFVNKIALIISLLVVLTIDANGNFVVWGFWSTYNETVPTLLYSLLIALLILNEGVFIRSGIKDES